MSSLTSRIPHIESLPGLLLLDNDTVTNIIHYVADTILGRQITAPQTTLPLPDFTTIITSLRSVLITISSSMWSDDDIVSFYTQLGLSPLSSLLLSATIARRDEIRTILLTRTSHIFPDTLIDINWSVHHILSSSSIRSINKKTLLVQLILQDNSLSSSLSSLSSYDNTNTYTITMELSNDELKLMLESLQKPLNMIQDNTPMFWDVIMIPTEGFPLGPLLFLMAIYGYILTVASQYMAEGAELLLNITGPGIIGGILIPILGALPDSMMILMSGLGNGPKEEIQHELSVGVGTLAGSTIMLLTIPYAASIFLGARQIGPHGRALNKEVIKTKRTLNFVTGEYEDKEISIIVPMKPKQWSLTGVGTTSLSTTAKTAKAMMLTGLAYLIIQIPTLFYRNDADQGAQSESLYALIGFIVTITSFFIYLYWTYTDEDAIEIVAEKQRQLIISSQNVSGWANLKSLLGNTNTTNSSIGDTSGTDGTPINVTDPFLNGNLLFSLFDKDGDGFIGYNEMVQGWKQIGYSFNDYEAQRWFTIIDHDRDNSISRVEFLNWIEDYLLPQFALSQPAANDDDNDNNNNDNSAFDTQQDITLDQFDQVSIYSHANQTRKQINIPSSINHTSRQHIVDFLQRPYSSHHHHHHTHSSSRLMTPKDNRVITPDTPIHGMTTTLDPTLSLDDNNNTVPTTTTTTTNNIYDTLSLHGSNALRSQSPNELRLLLPKEQRYALHIWCANFNNGFPYSLHSHSEDYNTIQYNINSETSMDNNNDIENINSINNNNNNTDTLSVDSINNPKNPLSTISASLTPDPYLRVLVITKVPKGINKDTRCIDHNNNNHISSLLALRPRLRPLISGYPVWASASPALFNYFITKQNTNRHIGQTMSPKTIFDELFVKYATLGGYEITLPQVYRFNRHYPLGLTPGQLKFQFYTLDTDLNHALTKLEFITLLEGLVDVKTIADEQYKNKYMMSSTSPSDLGSIMVHTTQNQRHKQIDNATSHVGDNNNNTVTTTSYGALDNHYDDNGILITDNHHHSDDAVHETMSITQSNTSSIHDDDDDDDDDDTEIEEHNMSPTRTLITALAYIIGGVLTVIIFSDPIIDVIAKVGILLNISPFYISFLVTPLVSNASEVIATLQFAKKSTDVSTGLTLATLHGAATMNNTLCLSVFMALLYFRGLAWTFTAEVIATMFVMYLVGIIGLKHTLVLWKALAILSLFPISLAMIAGLHALGV